MADFIVKSKKAYTTETSMPGNAVFNAHFSEQKKILRANAPKNRAKSANRGHSSNPNLPSFSVCNKVLMSL